MLFDNVVEGVLALPAVNVAVLDDGMGGKNSQLGQGEQGLVSR